MGSAVCCQASTEAFSCAANLIRGGQMAARLRRRWVRLGVSPGACPACPPSCGSGLSVLPIGPLCL
jgi:hypothetical protein